MVFRADDNARVPAFGAAMKTDEMQPVECEHRAPFTRRKLNHLVVRDAMVRPSGFLRSENVVSQLPKGLDHEAVKILVGIQARSHRGSGLLVLANRLLDFRGMRFHIVPNRRKIASAEGRIIHQQLILGEPAPPALLDRPHWEARARHTRVSTTNSRRPFDAPSLLPAALLDEEQKNQHLPLHRFRRGL